MNNEMKHVLDLDDHIDVGETRLFRMLYPDIDQLESGLSKVGGYTCVKSNIQNAYIDSTSVVLNSTISNSIIMSGFVDNSQLATVELHYSTLKAVSITDSTINMDLSLTCSDSIDYFEDKALLVH